MRPSTRKIRLPRFGGVLFAIIVREMATSYGRSYFGYLWALLEPIGAIAVMSIAFSVALRAPAVGESFPLFYATGYIPFVFYSAIQNSISSSVRENRKLLFYPRVTYADVIIGRFLLVFTTQLLVGIIVLAGILKIYNINLHLDIAAILNASVAASILGLGIGTLNSVLMFLVPAWRPTWAIITRPIFLLSCVFFLYDTAPVWAQSVLWYNPLVHVVGLTRTGVYSSYHGHYVMIMYPYLVGIVTLLWGLLLLKRYAADIVND